MLSTNINNITYSTYNNCSNKSISVLLFHLKYHQPPPPKKKKTNKQKTPQQQQKKKQKTKTKTKKQPPTKKPPTNTNKKTLNSFNSNTTPPPHTHTPKAIKWTNLPSKTLSYNSNKISNPNSNHNSKSSQFYHQIRKLKGKKPDTQKRHP